MAARHYFLTIAAVSLASAAVMAQQETDAPMTFFVTGEAHSRDFGGLAGADAICQRLAAEAEAEAEAGAGARVWRAYLSTDGSGGVNARDRIGSGPWFNAEGVRVAGNLDELHYSNVGLTKATQLNENGEVVNGRGDDPNRHDILTGSNLDGTRFTDGEDHTCENWTSNGQGSAQVGHHDRTGGGPVPSSWNSAHGSRGCGQADLQGTGGNGYFYCFAID